MKRTSYANAPTYLRESFKFPSHRPGPALRRALKSFSDHQAKTAPLWDSVVKLCTHPESHAEYESYSNYDTLGNCSGSTEQVWCGVCKKLLHEDRT